MDTTRYIRGRLVASQIRPLDQVHLDGTWWTVTETSEINGVVRLTVGGLPTCYSRHTPLMTRWQAANTTTGMRREVRR